jgi:hypothetical protein
MSEAVDAAVAKASEESAKAIASAFASFGARFEEASGDLSKHCGQPQDAWKRSPPGSNDRRKPRNRTLASLSRQAVPPKGLRAR